MERLTERINGVVVYVGAHNDEAGGQTAFEVRSRGVREILARLAEYEDTGLTPESVEALKLSMMGKAISEIKEFNGLPIDRLKELAEADKEDRVAVLPCKVGDTVWIAGSVRGVYSAKVRTFFCGCPSAVRGADDDGHIQMIRTTECDIPIRNFGKTVFLTREEAEEALRRAENG